MMIRMLFTKIFDKFGDSDDAIISAIICMMLVFFLQPFTSKPHGTICTFIIQILTAFVMFHAQKERVHHANRLRDYLNTSDIKTIELDSKIINTTIEIHLIMDLIETLIILFIGKESIQYKIISPIETVIFIVFLAVMIYDYLFSKSQKIIDKALKF